MEKLGPFRPIAPQSMAAGSITTAYALAQSDGKLQTLGDVYGASPVGSAVAKDDLPLATLSPKQ